jgi:uroporphyrinogen-III synthase
MSRPLEGRTVALAEGRQLDELVRLLEAEGATPLPCPMLSIRDAPDSAPVLAWVDDLIAGRMQLVVLMTGEALRRLLGFAERAGRRDAFVAALSRVPTITRGPKPVKALKEIGLTPARVAKAPTTEGVIATLREESLQGKTVGVTLYGEPNPALEQFLAAAGATMRPTMPYVYAEGADEDRIADLIARMALGEVDVLVLTSSPQVDRLYEVAARRQSEEALREGLNRARVAVVGPVVAASLRERGAPVHICPDQGFVMKNLVQHIKRSFEAQAPE